MLTCNAQFFTHGYFRCCCLQTDVTVEQLKDVFIRFMDEPDRNKILIAPDHIPRGFAFVDLGSQAAVAKAVSASRMEGVKMNDKKLSVEPSKKPVRPSGLKAANERRGTSATSSATNSYRGGAGRGNGAVRKVP